MSKLYEILRDEKGLKDADIARIAGVSRASMSQWKSGQFTFKYDKMVKIADALGVSVEYLIAGETGATPVKKEGSTTVPILGYVAAGIPISAITDIVGEVTISKHQAKKGEHFALRIKGDSMYPTIMEGDVVIVRCQNFADNGNTVIVQIGNEDAVCKKVTFTQSGMVLRSINPAYDPYVFASDEIIKRPVQIIGKVVEVRRELE